MKLLVELLAKKTIEMNLKKFESEESLIKEITELLSEDEGAAFIEVLKDWAEQKAGHSIEIIPLH